MAVISVPPEPWQTVLDVAADRGVRVWLVGGAVRDILLDRAVRDWDFTAERDALGLARAVANALGGAYYVLDATRDTGRALLKTAGGAGPVLDFAGLRGPDIDSDLGKRDFTINAMAIDSQGVLLDPLGGQADLQRRRLCVTSHTAFSDDPLRLLRAVRVAAEFGLEIDAETLALIRRQAPLVSQASAERVRDVLMRVMAMPRAAGALQMVEDVGLLAYVVPELARLRGLAQSPPHRFSVWKHSLAAVDFVQVLLDMLAATPDDRGGTWTDAPEAAWDSLSAALAPHGAHLRSHLSVEVSGGHDRSAVLKLATLLHDVGKPDTQGSDDDGRIHYYDHGPVGARLAAARLKQMRFSRQATERVAKIVRAHLRPAQLARAETLTRRATYRFFRAVGDAGVEVVLLSLADHLATWGPNLQAARWNRRLEVAAALLGSYFDCHQEHIAPTLFVTGRDLIEELGLRPGPHLGLLLERIQEAQVVGEVRSREEALALARNAPDGP